MRTRAKGISRAAVFAAGFVALGVTAIPSNAFADVTSGNGGILSGNQVDAPISAPVDVSGNAAALLGTGSATSHGGATVHQRGGNGQQTSGAHGIASGNQVDAPISVPVNVCGNAVGVLGHADAGCTGGAKATGGGKSGQVTDGAHGVIAGNQVNAPISVPVDVCGNAVAIAGDAVAGCEGGSVVKHAGNTGSGQQASGIFGVGSGNQGNLPISVPVDVCGNAVGSGAASCAGGASVHDGGHGTVRQTTDGAVGIIAGNQVNAPISIPATVCGNAAGVVGQAWAFCEGGAHVHGPHDGSGTQTSGGTGVGGGNQVDAPVQIPAEVCGNAAAIVGTASALCEDAPGYGGDDGYGDDDGYGGYYRATGIPISTAFPALPGVATDLPTTPGALPSLPPANGRKAPGNVLTTDGIASAANGVLANNTLPGSGALSSVQPDGLAATGDLVRTVGLSRLVGLPMANHRAQGGLPGTDDVVAPNALPKLDGDSALNGRRVPADLSAAHGILPANALPQGLTLNGLSTADTAGTNGLLPAAAPLPDLATRRAKGGLPGADGLVPTNTLPELDGASTLDGRRVRDGLPGVGGLVPANAVPGLDGRRVHDGLPGVGGLVPAGLLPGVGGLVPAGLVPGAGGPVRGAGVARQGGAPVAVSVLDARALPGGGVVRRPIGLRAVDALRSPARAVVPATPVAGHEIVPVTGEIGPVRNVAARETVSDGAGSLWAFAASGVLGVLAGALTLARRVRLDGRR
ncbi:chaplin family protein [Spirillospora sp. NPDC047418]